MTTQTKALLSFVFYTILLPAIIAFGLAFLFNSNFLIAWFSLTALSVLIEKILEKGVTAKRISDFTDKYSNLPYKKYMVRLNCQNCHHVNVIEMDLNKNTEFVCSQCQRKNAVYTTFTTAIASKHEVL